MNYGSPRQRPWLLGGAILAALCFLIGSEMSSTTKTTLWERRCLLERWAPSDAGQSMATVHIETRAGTPPMFGEQEYSFYWQLQARSVTPGTKYSGTFLVPIAFLDPVEEGILAVLH